MTTNEEPVMGNKQLIKYLIISILIGGFVLVTAILPAEYNIDPLGTGKLLDSADFIKMRLKKRLACKMHL